MGRKKGVPAYCLHKATGQAVARVNGRDHYLGKYGTPGSRAAYAELIARLGRGVEEPAPRALSVAELVRRYDDFAASYYVKNGRPTRQLERVRRSLGLAVELYGTRPADAFGPAALEAVRDRMVSLGWSRKHVNSCVGCVRRCWRWAAAKQLVGAGAHAALCTLDGLREGRTAARETAPVGPADDRTVEATLAKMRPETADMVRLQRLTAMRAGEICALVAEEIDRTADVWVWRPADHKTRHAGKGRVILFGPRAQAVLAPHLLACGGAGYVFSPKRTLANLAAERRARAKAPGKPGRRAARPKRPPGDCYTSNSYQKAIRDAADAAGVPRWHSHQLRHAAATALRAAFGVEVAQHVLGHARLETAQVYAERNLAAAVEAARRAG